MKKVNEKINDLLKFNELLSEKLVGYDKMIDVTQKNIENNGFNSSIKITTMGDAGTEELVLNHTDANFNKLNVHALHLISEGKKFLVHRIAEVEKELEAITAFVAAKHDKVLNEFDEYKDEEELAMVEAERQAKANKIAEKEAHRAEREAHREEVKAEKEAHKAERDAIKAERAADKEEAKGHLDEHFDELEKESGRKGFFRN